MNIHPIFVHFPVTLFTVYSIFEIARFKIITRQQWWFYTKAILVIGGAATACIALITGDMAEEVYQGLSRKIVEAHSTVATITTIVYGVIALFYIIGWLRRSNINPLSRFDSDTKIWEFLLKTESKMTEGLLGVIFALIGGALITLTGALGGLLAYGPSNDPLSAFLYSLLIK